MFDRSIVYQQGDHLVVDVAGIVPLSAGVHIGNGLALGGLDGHLNGLVTDLIGVPSATTEATAVQTAANALLNIDGLAAVFCSNEGAVTGFLAATAEYAAPALFSRRSFGYCSINQSYTSRAIISSSMLLASYH